MAIIMIAVTVNTFGQSMTYNHDASKMGQIQVMELGAGVLTPDLYYSITHSSYKKGAKSATSVKNTLRMAANIASISQVEYADSIKADLEARTKVEVASFQIKYRQLEWKDMQRGNNGMGRPWKNV